MDFDVDLVVALARCSSDLHHLCLPVYKMQMHAAHGTALELWGEEDTESPEHGDDSEVTATNPGPSSS